MMNRDEDIHRSCVVIDGHCDTLLELYKHKRSFWEQNNHCHLNWPLLQMGKVNLQFLAIYIEPEYKPYGALCRVMELLDHYHTISSEGEIQLKTILKKEDLSLLAPDTSCMYLLAIEGGEVLEGKISTLRILSKLGIRCMTLTWNQRNKIADGVWEKDSQGGLTTFGREVVKEMNRIGMLIDVSHISEKGFWDVISQSNKPIAATHSCCAALHKHPRNLTNEQLAAIKANKGIVGINFYPGFLGEGEITIDTVIEHLEYAVSVAGIDHVGLGSDFDGIDKTPLGLSSPADLPQITKKLIIKGWSREDIRKVLGGNYVRLLQNTLP